MWTGSSRPGLLFVLSACRMVSSVLPAAGNQPQAAAAGMTRLWRPGGETVLDAVHAVQQKPQQGQQQNSNDDHDTRPSRLTAPPRVPTASTASQRDTRRPGKRGGGESKTGDRSNVPRPDDTARHRQGRTLRPPQVSWPFPVRLRTTARPPRAHAHANATSPRPSADGSTGQAASAPGPVTAAVITSATTRSLTLLFWETSTKISHASSAGPPKVGISAPGQIDHRRLSIACLSCSFSCSSRSIRADMSGTAGSPPVRRRPARRSSARYRDARRYDAGEVA